MLTSDVFFSFVLLFMDSYFNWNVQFQSGGKREYTDPRSKLLIVFNFGMHQQFAALFLPPPQVR